MTETWKDVADRLELLATTPTAEQNQVSHALKIKLNTNVPAHVAAVILKSRLVSTLMERLPDGAEIPEALTSLEAKLGIENTTSLFTGSHLEVSAWFASRYMLLTAKGLRDLQPQIGDVVARFDAPAEHLVISSIGDNGRIYMRGGRGKGAWPNNLKLIARKDDSEEYEKMVMAAAATLRNGQTNYSPNSRQLAALAKYRIASYLPTRQAIRELEDLLEAGERLEAPFQQLLERQPQLLASLVTGNLGTYVIPKQALGTEHITDFLVLGISSIGPQWVAVELEAPRHQLLTLHGELRSEVQHALNQIYDWREWLTTNVSYAQSTLHLHGLTNQVQGLVVIGRDDPQIDRQPARAQIAEQQNIHIHSWDWILRQAERLISNGLQSPQFAVNSADDEEGLP